MGCWSSRDASSPRNVSNSNIIGGSYSNHYSYNNNENNYSSNVKINFNNNHKKSEEVKIDSSTYKFSSNYSIKQKLLASKDIHIPIIKDLEELHKIKTTTEHKLTPELKNEVFGEGTNGFKEHYENPEIDSDVMNTAVTIL